MLKRCFAAGLVLLMAGTALAQNEKPAPKPEKTTERQAAEPKPLLVGDKAPDILVKKWVKGEPVTGFEKGKVYVVEFWATWCGPCKQSIPHLTELQSKFKDKGVTFVGVSVWESDDTKIEPFVKDQGDKMDYRVAIDDMPALPPGVENASREAQEFRVDNGRMSQTWMAAAERGGIPSAFVVNQEGKVVWIGHPMIGLDEVVANVVEGKHDLNAATEKFKAEYEKAHKQNEGGRAIRQYKKLLGQGDVSGATAKVRNLIDTSFKDNAQALNQIAWYQVDPAAKIKSPDLDLALKAAKRAAEITKEEEPGILDTLALVYFKKGDLNKALELQKKAVSLATDQMKEELEGRLKEFEDAAKKEKK